MDAPLTRPVPWWGWVLFVAALALGVLLALGAGIGLSSLLSGTVWLSALE